MNDFNIAYHVN